MNNYLGLDTDDMMITQIINKLSKSIKPTMSNEDFKKTIIELDNIQNDELSEYDEDLIAEVYNNLNKKMGSHISHHLTDTTIVNGQTFGQLMRFLLTIGY